MEIFPQAAKRKISDRFPVARSEQLDILFRWARYSSRFNLGEVLKKNNIHKIAIYGGGVLGVVLFENLCQYIEIECIVDKNPSLSFPYEVRTILPTELELMRDVDAVIITVDFYDIEQIFRPYTKCLALNDLIIDLDEYFLFEKAVQHITECKTTLLLADLTEPTRYIKNPSFFEAMTIYGSPVWKKYYDKEIMLSYFNDLESFSPSISKKLLNTLDHQ